MDASRTHRLMRKKGFFGGFFCLFSALERNTGEEILRMKSLVTGCKRAAGDSDSPSEADTSRSLVEGRKKGRIKREKLMRGAYLELFDVP